MRHRDEIAELLNRLPEVRWDRCVFDGDDGSVYGWVARDDGRSDFILMRFVDMDGQLGMGFTTSSSRYSSEFAERLLGDAGTHVDCDRVEDIFGELVPTAIRAEA